MTLGENDINIKRNIMFPCVVFTWSAGARQMDGVFMLTISQVFVFCVSDAPPGVTSRYGGRRERYLVLKIFIIFTPVIHTEHVTGERKSSVKM